MAGRNLLATSLLMILCVLAAVPARADHVLAFFKDDAADDDAVKEGPPQFQVRTLAPPGRVHWILRIENMDPTRDAALDFVMDDLSQEDSAQGVFPPVQRLDCSVAPGNSGSSTPVSVECPVAPVNDPGTPLDEPNTIRFTGVTVPAGGTVTLDFWADVREGFEGRSCNRALLQQTHDGSQTQSTDVLPGGPSCIEVGSGTVGDPIFTKSDADDDDVHINPQTNEPATFPGGKIHWVIQLNNPLIRAMGGQFTDDLPPGVIHDCSTFNITSDCGWIFPDPASCCDAARDPELDCRFDDIPSGCLLTIDIWSTVPTDPVPDFPCNQAMYFPDEGGAVGSNNGTNYCIGLTQGDNSIHAVKSATDDNGGDLEPGDVITWTIEFFNDGGFPWQTTLTDDLEPYLDLVPGSLMPFSGVNCQENDTDNDGRIDQIVCPDIPLPAQASTAMTFQTVLTCTGLDPEAGACNIGTFRVPFPPFNLTTHPPGPKVPVPTCLPVTIPFEVTTTKTALVQDTDGDGVLSPGEQLTYVISVENTGTRPHSNLEIRDPVPAGVSYVPGSILVDGAAQTDAVGDDQGEFSGGEVLAYRSSLAVGETAELRFTVATSLGTPDHTAFCNTALVESDEIRACAGTFTSNELCNAVEDIAKLQIQKTAVDENGGTVQQGDVLTYRLTLTNTGGRRAEDIEIADTIPAGTTYVAESMQLAGFQLTDAAGDDAGEFDGSAARARASVLSAGGTLVFTFQVTVDAVPAGTTVTNTGSATAIVPPLQVDSNPVTFTVEGSIEPQYQLTVSKEARDASGQPLQEVSPGDRFVYVVTVCNDAASSDPAPDVLVTDAVPTGTSYVAGSLTLDGVAKTDAAGDDEAESDGTMVSAHPGDLAPGACVDLDFEVRVDAGVVPGTMVRNTATAAGEGGAGQSAEGGADLTVVAPTVDLLRGLVLTTDVPDADSCPIAPQQLPRLDPVLDLCGAALCPPIVPGLSWTVVGDGQLGGDPRVYYEATGVDCSRILTVRRPSGADDLEVEVTP